jgi:hypothetical protein
MPATIDASWLNDRQELTYDVLGTDKEADVRAAVDLAAPASFRGLPIRLVQCEPIGHFVWKAVVTYGEIA